MDYTFYLAGALLLGALHALDADHLATVSALIVDRRPFRTTCRLALQWCAGHSLTLLVLAGGMLAMKSVFQAFDLSNAERWVGGAMVCLGCWVFARQWRDQAASKSHAPRDGWVLFGMGVLHGAAGSSSIILLIPVTLAQSVSLVLAYVLLFSVGMIMTMGLYSFTINRLLWLEQASHHIAKLRYLSAGLAVVVGLRLMG